MRAIRACILIALAAGLWACGGSGPATSTLYPDIYVNPTIGSDITGDGSYIQPFRSITAAMANAQSGDVVKAEEGTYGAPHETFPIRVTDGVALIGDEASRGSLTVIEGMGSFGSGEAALVPGDNTMVAGFLIRTNDISNTSSGALYINTTGVVVRNNTLTGSYWGLFSDNGPGTVKVQGNIIKDNEFGVDLRHTGMDLGGGAGGSTGLNHFVCSATYDIYLAVDGAMARNNYWDNPSPFYNGVGNDIYVKYVGNTIDTTGASQSTYACP